MVWERLISLSKVDCAWDIQFWQAQSPAARFSAAWSMLQDFYKIKGRKSDAGRIRLQRSVENFKQA